MPQGPSRINMSVLLFSVDDIAHVQQTGFGGPYETRGIGATTAYGVHRSLPLRDMISLAEELCFIISWKASWKEAAETYS